jgi:hypothetical protein
MAAVRGRNRTQMGQLFGLFLVAGGATGAAAARKGGASMTLAQMRARERAQLEAIRRDDDELLPLIWEFLTGGRR